MLSDASTGGIVKTMTKPQVRELIEKMCLGLSIPEVWPLFRYMCLGLCIPVTLIPGKICLDLAYLNLNFHMLCVIWD